MIKLPRLKNFTEIPSELENLSSSLKDSQKGNNLNVIKFKNVNKLPRLENFAEIPSAIN